MWGVFLTMQKSSCDKPDVFAGKLKQAEGELVQLPFHRQQPEGEPLPLPRHRQQHGGTRQCL